MFTPIGFAPGVPAEYYESIGQQSIADRLREAQAASNPVAPLSNAELFSSASRAASSPLLQGNSSAFVDPPSPSGLSSVSSVATPVQINQAFEDYLGRPVDTSGLEGYLSMGKSIDDIRADLAYVASQSPETKLASDVKYYEAPSDLQLTYIQGLGGGIPTFTNPNLYTSSIYKTPQSSNVEALNINPQLGTVKPTTEVGEFVGPVLPGSEKPSPTTATDLTLTPSFLTQVQAEEDVRQAFDRVLGRQPFKGSGLDYWTNELVKGNVTLADLDQAIAKGAQGDDRLAANKFLGTNYFKVADPTTVPYASLLQPTTTVTDQPSVVETYNQKAQERVEQDKPLFNTWEDLPNIDETEIQMAKDAGYQSPGAYFLAKVESTDPSLSSWRESTRQEILGSKDLKDQYEDLYKPPIGRDAEETIYQELKRQYEVANENGFGYRHESDLEAIWRREAGILAASGVKSLYDIGTRPVERSSVIEVGSRRPDYQYGEPKETINNVYKRGNDYYYEAGDDEGAPFPIKIDPARILDVQEDVKTRRQQGEDESDYVYYSGIKIQVKDDPRIEVINKNTNDPVYDIELHNEWRDDPSAYNLLNKPIEVETNPYRGFNRIHTNYGVRGAADLSFQMIPDGQGGEIPFILPIYRSTKTDLTPLAMFASMFLGPYAGAIGKYLGATTVAGQAALGAAVISGGTQLVVNGKIDPGRLLASAATAGIAETGGFTGSDIAEYSASLAEQGLGSAQIVDDLVSIGVNPVTANLAGTFASAGIAVEIAPMITAGVQNMGLTALAMGELDADALTQSFLTGAGGEASSLAVDKIIGDENLQTIADATGLSKDQAGSIATSALMNGINSEVTGTNNFFDSVFQTLVVSGVSTVTANKVAAALDDTTSDKGRAAIVGATKNIMDVAGTAAWNDMDVGDALDAMAPGIIGSAFSTYVRTPETTKTDDKAKAEVEGVEVAGIVSRGTMDALKTKALIGETVTDTQVDDQGYTQKTFTGVDNSGNPYTYKVTYDAKGDTSYSWTDAQGTPQISRQRPEFKSVTPATSADQIDLKNKDDEEATAWYMSDLFFGGAFKDFKTEDIPVVGGLFKTAAKNQGIGLDGLGNQLKDYSTSYSLITGTPFETTMQGIGDGLIAYGKELGSENYLKEINQFNNDYIKQASEVRSDGLGKSAWDRYTDWWSMARDNPGAAAGSVLYELGQETLPLAAAATVLLAAPTAVGAGAAVTLAVATSSLLDANEVFGNTGADRYQYGIANGESEDVARTNAIKEAGVNAFATLGTEFLADKSLMGLYAGGLKTSIALGLGATKAIIANWGGEYVEALAHTYNTAAQRGIPIDDNFHNNARSLAVLEATIGKNTATSIASPAIVSSVAIGVNENGDDVTLEDLRSGEETLASVKLDAPVNVTESGDTLTLGGLTAILQENDIPVDFELDIDTPIFQSSDGAVITYNDLEALSSLNDQSFAEVIEGLSNNQIQLPKELTNPVDTTVQGGGINQNLASINLAKADSITIDSTKDTNPDTGITVTETINIRPDSTIDPDPKVDPNTNININTVTVTNPNDSSEVTVDVVTDPNNNVPTEVVATEIAGGVKVDITPPIKVNVGEPITQGTPIKEAVVKAVEDTKEKAKTSGSGAGTALTGAGMALPALGSLVDEGRDLNPLVTTGKREFESPLAAFMRMVSGEENVEPPPVEKKEPSMDYYSYGKSAEIDDVLGDVTPSGLPNFEFAELGEMGPSFQMRSGGLVPPFAGGGPLTMAAGKLRKDYRQGDAVEGPGDGQSDDIPAMLADGEFVIPADVVAALGNGSNKAGADKLYDMMHNIRRQARQGNPKDLPKPAKSPLQYMTRR
jgi:hypothetical protein